MRVLCVLCCAADKCVQSVSNATITSVTEDGLETDKRSVQFAYYGPGKQVRRRA